MFTADYWKAVTERAVKGAAVGVATVLGGDLLPGQFAQADWGNIGQASLYGALASFVLSLISTPFGPGGTPSLVRDRAAAEPPDPIVDLADRDARRRDPLNPEGGQHRY